MGRRSPMGGRRFVAVGAALAVLAGGRRRRRSSPVAGRHPPVGAHRPSASTEYGSGTQWAAMSAAGEPDVTEYGDSQLAWTPKAKDGTTDWLDLRYDQAVIPTGIGIHESFSPGFVTKVEAYHTADAAWVTLWEGTDPTPAGDLGHLLAAAQGRPTSRSTASGSPSTPDIPDYNEIDAVELVGTPPGSPVGPDRQCRSAVARRGTLASALDHADRGARAAVPCAGSRPLGAAHPGRAPGGGPVHPRGAVGAVRPGGVRPGAAGHPHRAPAARGDRLGRLPGAAAAARAARWHRASGPASSRASPGCRPAPIRDWPTRVGRSSPSSWA